jgi:hypothetical protein
VDSRTGFEKQKKTGNKVKFLVNKLQMIAKLNKAINEKEGDDE